MKFGGTKDIVKVNEIKPFIDLVLYVYGDNCLDLYSPRSLSLNTLPFDSTVFLVLVLDDTSKPTARTVGLSYHLSFSL